MILYYFPIAQNTGPVDLRFGSNLFSGSLSSGPVLRHLTESSITTTEINYTLLLPHCSETVSENFYRGVYESFYKR